MCIATLAASCGGQSKTTAATSSATAPASTPTATSSNGARPGTPAGTSSARHTPHASPPATSTSPSAPRPAPPSPAVEPGRRYAGHGNRAIGTLALKSAVRLTWNAAKPKIQLFTSAGFMLVNSTKPTGSVNLTKGTYRGVRVASTGAWSLLVAPLH